MIVNHIGIQSLSQKSKSTTRTEPNRELLHFHSSDTPTCKNLFTETDLSINKTKVPQIQIELVSHWAEGWTRERNDINQSLSTRLWSGM